MLITGKKLKVFITLLNAIKNNKVLTAQNCLRRGADPNGYEDCSMMRPLHFAAFYRSYECAKILIEAGADPLLGNSDLETPLEYAMNRNDTILLFLFNLALSGKNSH